MGSVAQAVVEFDEAVLVPWRPPLGGAISPAARPVALRAVPSPVTRRSHAARAARLTVPDPGPEVPASTTIRRSPGGSTAARHTCTRCAGAVRRVPPTLRLTQRARRLLGALGAAGGIVLGVLLGSVVTGGDEGLVLVSDSSVVVQQGDTLWSIARSVAGEEDVRAVIDAIQELNDLEDATLHPGQVLRLP